MRLPGVNFAGEVPIINDQARLRPWADSQAAGDVREPGPLPGDGEETFTLSPADQARLLANLARFLVLVGIISGLFCLYVWQLSTILAVQKQTTALEREIERLERENVALMVEVSQLTTPAHIQQDAERLGMVPSDPALRVTLDAPGGSAAPSQGPSQLDVWTQQMARSQAWWLGQVEALQRRLTDLGRQIWPASTH